MPAGLVVIRYSLNYLQIYPMIELRELAFDDFECFILAHDFK
jgi:hypothetical protein